MPPEQPGDPTVVEFDVRTDEMIINMGPQHPSTHGVFRMNLRVDGETIVGLKPVMGYMHRNHEKIGERNTFLMNFPFTDRLDYLTSMCNNFGYALAVEQLMGDDAKVPERADHVAVLRPEGRHAGPDCDHGLLRRRQLGLGQLEGIGDAQ